MRCPRTGGRVEHTADGFNIGVCPTAQVCHRFLRIPAEGARVGVVVLVAVTAAQTDMAGIALRGRGRRNDLVWIDRYFSKKLLIISCTRSTNVI